MKRHRLTRVLTTVGGTLLLAGLGSAAVASTAHAAPLTAPVSARTAHHDEPLVSAFEQVSRSTSWTRTAKIPLSWWQPGVELEAMEVHGDRIYMAGWNHNTLQGHFWVLDRNGNLLKDITLVDGARDHAGGLSVYGDYAYVPLAVDHPHSSADILRINLNTYQVTKLFTVTYDHVGGLIYNPVTHLIIGQDWGSRVFYAWTLGGKQVATWNNPQDYIDYQDCQYVAFDKMLCSGVAGLGGGFRLGGFDLIDLSHGQHTILNEVPTTMTTDQGTNIAQNPTDLRAAQVPGGTQITMYAAPDNAIYEYTTTIPNTAG